MINKIARLALAVSAIAILLAATTGTALAAKTDPGKRSNPWSEQILPDNGEVYVMSWDRRYVVRFQSQGEEVVIDSTKLLPCGGSVRCSNGTKYVRLADCTGTPCSISNFGLKVSRENWSRGFVTVIYHNSNIWGKAAPRYMVRR